MAGKNYGTEISDMICVVVVPRPNLEVSVASRLRLADSTPEAFTRVSDFPM